MYKYITIGENISIPTYNLLIGIGLILGLLLLEKEGIKFNIGSIETEKIKTIILITFVIGFLGAFIFDGIVKGIPFRMEDIKQNIGFTFYGGFISGLFVLLIHFLFHKINFQKGINLLVPTLLIVHGFGRIGCFFAGCCYGKPTNSFLGIVFPKNSIVYEQNHGCYPVHPTQLYEAFAIFFLLYLTIKIMPLNRRIEFYLISYGVARFLIEFLRGDSRGEIFNQDFFSPSQLISIFLILCGLAIAPTTKIKLIKSGD